MIDNCQTGTKLNRKKSNMAGLDYTEDSTEGKTLLLLLMIIIIIITFVKTRHQKRNAKIAIQQHPFKSSPVRNINLLQAHTCQNNH